MEKGNTRVRCIPGLFGRPGLLCNTYTLGILLLLRARVCRFLRFISFYMIDAMLSVLCNCLSTFAVFALAQYYDYGRQLDSLCAVDAALHIGYLPQLRIVTYRGRSLMLCAFRNNLTHRVMRRVHENVKIILFVISYVYIISNYQECM